MRLMATAAGALVLLSATAWAQQPVARPPAAVQPPNDPDKASYMSAAEVAAGLAKLGNDRADASARIFQILPYTINAAHRAPVTQAASVHEAASELFYVIDGTATITTGGRLVGAARTGTNLSGTSIEGGTTQQLSKGDFLMVPAGVPHWFSEIPPGGISLMAMYLPKAN